MDCVAAGRRPSGEVVTQPEVVLSLPKQAPQSTLDLRRHFIMSPAYAILELRAAGHVIKNTPGHKRVAHYSLVTPTAAA